MILSVSRRTDIPNYYSEWFLNRLKEEWLYVRNPMNAHQVSKINLSPEVIDCIVFWTKNPEPMLARLDELKKYHYYFQFTLTGYGKDIECGVPHKREQMIPIFQELSSRIGKDKVIWRYDPILFNDVYTPSYHQKAFEQIAEALNGYTEQCVISFLDIYAKNKNNMKALNVYELEHKELVKFVQNIKETAQQNAMKIKTCAEKTDLSGYGIEHSACVDKDLIEKITECRIKAKKDKNQREECGCIESIEIGTYDTCPNGCRYCYANVSAERVRKNGQCYDAQSPLLCGQVSEDDKITERVVKSFKIKQLRQRIKILSTTV